MKKPKPQPLKLGEVPDANAKVTRSPQEVIAEWLKGNPDKEILSIEGPILLGTDEEETPFLLIVSRAKIENESN